MSDPVLAIAAGHDPLTVWPGSTGESILVAHDVSYFSGLGRLRPGEEVIWRIGCERAVYRVIGARIRRPGAPVSVPRSGSGLALITCWPTNALFWTTDRYVVTTALVAFSSAAKEPAAQGSVAQGSAAQGSDLKVPAPPGLVAKGLSTAQSGIVVDRLVLSGSPSSSFRQGPRPLAAANAALRDEAAAQKAAVARDRSWWSALAGPGVPLPAPWSLAYETDVRLVVDGATVTGAVLSSSSATVTLTVRDRTLFVSSVRS